MLQRVGYEHWILRETHFRISSIAFNDWLTTVLNWSALIPASGQLRLLTSGQLRSSQSYLLDPFPFHFLRVLNSPLVSYLPPPTPPAGPSSSSPSSLFDCRSSNRPLTAAFISLLAASYARPRAWLCWTIWSSTSARRRTSSCRRCC